MSNENNARLLALARRGIWISYASIILLIALPTLLWLFPGIDQLGFLKKIFPAAALIQAGSSLRIRIWMIAMIPVLVEIWGLWQSVAVFKLIEKGEMFSSKIVSYIGKLGISMIATGFAIPLSRVIVVRVIQVEKGANVIFGAFTPGLVFCAFLTLGIVILALTSVVREAIRLSEENKSFI